ncbi:MAG: Type 1 glutamine amidotransferase-like domain-containing protein [Candidatus Dojkabacteria bacterium]
MKRLLLSSKGLRNKALIPILEKLNGKPFSETTLTFVPSAMHFSSSDKHWFFEENNPIAELGLKELQIAELWALPRVLILERFSKADILFFSGGHAPSFLHVLEEKELVEPLKQMLKDKIYFGSSATSQAAGPDLLTSNQEKIDSYNELTGYKPESGLGLVDFYTRAHYKSPKHKQYNKEYVEDLATKTEKKIYAIDDGTAVLVKDTEISVVGGGEYLVLN